MAQSFFETGQQAFLVAGIDIDDAIAAQARLGQAGRKQVGMGGAPQDLAAAARGDAGNEQGRCRAIDGPAAAAGDLMQGAACQPPTRQPFIDRFDAERQHPGRPAAAVQPVDVRAQLHKRDGGRLRHDRAK